MPYYHLKCGGEIGILRRKCKKCGKKWPFWVWFQYPLPKDISMFYLGKSKERGVKKPRRYPKWTSKFPLATDVANLLPDWPRWARILTTVIFVGGVITLVTFLWRLLR